MLSIRIRPFGQNKWTLLSSERKHIKLVTRCTTARRGCRSKTNFWGCKMYLHEIFPNLPEKNFEPLFVQVFSHETAFRMTSNKERSPYNFGGHFFQTKACWAPFLPRFPRILPHFSRISARFSPNQNFWGCACIPYTPTSNTSGEDVSRCAPYRYSKET